MKEKLLYALWGAVYVICTGLGFVREPEGMGKVLMVLSGFIFFLPGLLLLLKARKEGNRKGILRIRILSILSLSLTLILLICNFLSLPFSAAAGKVLYVLLILVSSPMICIRYWVFSLFLWACLLMGTFGKTEKAPIPR